ncbi:hypothetical protein [Jannaschia sp. 2305UL9-9]|uniref:hypothetical protein n=1 Tax=Jannaschia sp. 2305UL9-9 TaxID=3121638 RepID=UPI00352794A4
MFRTLGLGVIAATAVMAFHPAQAQRLGGTSGPAEIPPSSFTGAQYVDSEGCVFIRAGVDGATRWVPRVNRDRSVVCGAAPSRTAAAPAPAVAPVTTPAPTETAAAAPTPAPVQTAEPVIRRQPATAAPRTIVEAAPRRAAPPPVVSAPARRVAAAPAPRRAAAPRPMRQVVRAPAPQPQPQVTLPPGCGASALSARYLPGCSPTSTAAQPSRVVTLTAPSVVTTPSQPVRGLGRNQRAGEQVVVTTTAPANARRISPTAPSANRATTVTRRPVATGACQGASDVSARYLGGASRCGGDAGWSPQRQSSVDSNALTTNASTRSAGVVVVPAARTTFDVTHPPAGYRAAWTDGRLNPQRGPRTAQGDYQSQAIWTSTTPRQLRPVILTTR